MIQGALHAERAATSAPPASNLGIHRNTLQRKMVEYGLGNGRARAASRWHARRAPQETEERGARKRMDLLIFDLDGTLIDSRLDLANAVNATRRHMGMEPLDERARLLLCGQWRAGADPARDGRAGDRGGSAGGARVLPGVLSRARPGLHGAVSRA